MLLTPDQQAEQTADHHGDEHAGPARPVAPEQDGGQQRDAGRCGGINVEIRQLPVEIDPGVHEGLTGWQCYPDVMLELAGGDQDGGPRGKADHHTMGDEIDQLAHARQTEGQLESACEEGQCQHHADEFRTAGDREGLYRGQYHDGNRSRGSRNQVMGGTEQARHDRRYDGGVKTVLRRQAGDQRKGNTLGQHDHRTGNTRKEIGPQRLPAKQRPPAQEGKYPVPPQVGNIEWIHG